MWQPLLQQSNPAALSKKTPKSRGARIGLSFLIGEFDFELTTV